MNMPWKKTSDTYESSAKVVDGNLILSLPDAINPIVWRMELGSVKASALEVKQHTSDGTFLLSLKTPKGEVHDIAPFRTRELAVRALMRVSNALQGAQGKIAPIATSGIQAAPVAATNILHKSDASPMKWVLTLGGVLLVIFLFALLSSMGPESGSGYVSSGTMGGANEQSGVPQSADDVLGRGF